MSIKKTSLICLFFALFTAASAIGAMAQPAPATAKPAAAPEGITLDFKGIELADLIQTVSELTGKNFLYDDSVKGKVTIISPKTMSLDEAYQLFLTVLSVKGYTVVPSGKVNKIVAIRDAKESNLPTVTGERRGPTGEQFVTRLVPLQNIDATLMATTVLAPLIPKTSNIVAYPPSNTLIITDNGANIERLMKIITELDVPSSLDLIEVFPLKYAGADEVAAILNQILTQAAASPRRGRAAANVQTAGGKEVSKILPYVRTNTLVVMATPEDLTIIRTVIAQLDQRPTQERSHINVYYLENADAETLAKTLNEILSGVKAPITTGRAAPPAGQAATLTTAPVSITADKPTNSLIINSTPEDYDIFKGIVSQLDIKRKQVFVEALILEISMDATRDLGASLAGFIPTGDEGVIYGGMNQQSPALGVLTPGTSGVPSLLTQSIEGVLAGGLFNMINVTAPDGTQVAVPAISALINLSKKDSDINILSAPRLLTSDNEEAEIIIGSNVPIITSRLTDTGGSTGLAQSVTVERKDVALTLRFTPQITEGNQVRLNIFQEITDIAETSLAGNVNEVGPTFTKRLLRNTILAEDGRTVVLGGLIRNNEQVTISKVPFLGDIPGLGWLFKRKTNSNTKTNLLIFITPKIVKNADDLEKVTQSSRRSMDDFQEGILPALPPERIQAYPAPLDPPVPVLFIPEEEPALPADLYPGEEPALPDDLYPEVPEAETNDAPATKGD
ncbi:type II secretion system protein GspD [Desulfuromonas soudanensis]|uniref:Type II secretion system protein GspD n=1 Tax=Desulfuromonas soudanensis TaxID=1603606 RepID=A0A0M4D0G8_9BACT|nr:type II secretion system secretin GspD [Desulfuromonas soudanensis]ALC15364.1 type II secretion system protein GspD [Desulfuromonas soudanensis]